METGRSFLKAPHFRHPTANRENAATGPDGARGAPPSKAVIGACHLRISLAEPFMGHAFFVGHVKEGLDHRFTGSPVEGIDQCFLVTRHGKGDRKPLVVRFL